jgi:hypothetical protein
MKVIIIESEIGKPIEFFGAETMDRTDNTLTNEKKFVRVFFRDCDGNYGVARLYSDYSTEDYTLFDIQYKQETKVKNCG